MKSPLLLIAILAILSLIHSQNAPRPMVYQPFSQEELSQANSNYKAPQVGIEYEAIEPSKQHHGKKRHQKRPHPEESYVSQQPAYEGELTQQQRQERRMQRIRYNKVFRWGMIAGTAALAIIICKFCATKRRRRCQIMQQRRQQHIQMQAQPAPMQQPYVYNLSAYPYPVNQVPQVARPYYQQPQPVRQQMPPVQPTQLRQPEPQIVRGRPHESFIKEQSQSIEEQIRLHENMIMSLKEQKRREEAESRRRMTPININETLESLQPIRRKQIPVGQPIFEKDANSSFASEYPEI